MLHNSPPDQEATLSGLRDDHPPRIVAILPCHNRDRFIGSVLIKLQHYVDHVIVVNDGSTDQTSAVARQAGAEVIDYLTRQRSEVAVEHGLARALDLGADVLVLLEGDAQMIPEQIPFVLQPILERGADIVIGRMFPETRRSDGSGIPSVDWPRFDSGLPSGGLRAFTDEAVVACGMSPTCLPRTTNPGTAASDLRAVEVLISQPKAAQPARRRTAVPQDLLFQLFGKAGPVRLLLLLASFGLVLTTLGMVFWYQTVEIFATRSQLALGHALLGTLAVTVGIMVAFEALTLNVIRRLVEFPPRQRPDC